MSNTVDNKLMLRRLNTDVHNPCYLLYICDVNLLLDCCMDLSNLSYFLPKHQLMSPGCSDLPDMWDDKEGGLLTKIGDMNYINTDFKFCMLKSSEMSSIFWETVDAILVSNTRSILGLPFLFENTNFRGKVFATEPVVKFGKILIDDLFNELDQLFESQDNSGHSKTKVVKEFTDPVDYLLHSNEFNWTKFYTRESVTKALDKVHLVAYHEPVDLFGLLTIKGLSAGYGIGSCNWIITSSTEKVAYISHTSLLYSHVLPFDDSAFEDTDILIIGTVNLYASSHLEKTVEEFCHIVVQTLARGGNVLVPSNPTGIIFDLLETAIHAKDNFNGTLLPLFTHNHSSGGISDRIQNITSRNTITTTSIGTINNHSVQKPTSIPFTSVEIDLTSNCTSSTTITTTTTTQTLPTGGSSSSGLVARSPVLFISNQVHVSLAYSNAYGEWLNAVKEGVLYTADAPFPFQSLLRSGELVALKSLYDCSSSKKLSDSSTGNEYSSHSITSPLLLGTGNSTSSGGYFETSGINAVNSASVNSNNLVDSAIIALKSSSFCNAAHNNHIGSGGVWPNSPCLIFASHPSLRFGPSVHLARVLAYGGLRSGGRTSGPPHNSIILIESGDYVPSFEWNSKSLCSSEARLRRLISPFLQPDKLSTNQTSFSHIGTPSLTISDTATVYWLPMEARIGVHEIDHLVKRCGEPRVALILPQEVYDKPFDLSNITSRPEQFTSKIHGIPYGQQLCINLPDTRLEQVRLSTKLVSHIKPVYINVQSNPSVGTVNSVDTSNNNSDSTNKSKQKSQVNSSQPRNKSDIKRKLSTNNITTATTTTTTTTTTTAVASNADGNKECELKAQQSDETSQSKRKCIALVNGLLTTRDGKHWLIGKQEKLEPDVIHPVKDVVSRSINSTINDNTVSATTITPSTTTMNYQFKEYVQKFNMLTAENRVLVSCCDRSSRINPHELIQKLTEHGVTGAYVADSYTARQVYSRFSAYNNNDELAHSIENKDIILFPNPNTVICLHEHGSHIICMDESTRTAIRDTILLFVHHLDINSVV